MSDTIKNREQASAWQKQYDAFAPKVGEMAPDFQLLDVHGRNSVRLSEYQGIKPVALVFGSFTWPPYVRGTVSLLDIYRQYHERVQFLSIYIREAHPKDGWWLGKGMLGMAMKLVRLKAATGVYDPKTIEERRKVAGECEGVLKYGIRTYVDEMDDAVNIAYAAWPTRLYLVGVDGIVAYAGGLGPFGFKPTEFAKAIETYLVNQPAVSV